MAQFYGSIEGTGRTTATRTGTKSSGMTAHIRGWNVGARVVLQHVDGVDMVRVYETGGSNGGSETLVAEFPERRQPATV